MDNKTIAIHVVLFLFTAGIGNVLYFGYKRGWSKKQLAVAGVVVLVLVLALGAAAPSDGADTSPNVTDSPEEETDTSNEEKDNNSDEEEDNNSDEEETDTSDEGATDRWELSHQYMDTLEEEENIQISYVEISDSETLIEIEFTSQTEYEVGHSLGWAGGVYAEIVRQDAEAGDAKIVVKDYYTGEETGTATIDRETAERYKDGMLDSEEYAENILRKVEVTGEDEPRV